MAVMFFLTIVASLLLPTANALTPRDISILDDRFTTDLYPGGKKVCGDHICKIGEWSTMKHALQTHIHKSIICQDLKKWKACEITLPQKP